jgi:hypothetical protein
MVDLFRTADDAIPARIQAPFLPHSSGHSCAILTGIPARSHFGPDCGLTGHDACGRAGGVVAAPGSQAEGLMPPLPHCRIIAVASAVLVIGFGLISIGVAEAQANDVGQVGLNLWGNTWFLLGFCLVVFSAVAVIVGAPTRRAWQMEA